MYSRCIITFLIVHGMLTLFFLVSIRLYIVLYYLIFLCPTEWWYFLILAALFVCNIYLRVSVYRTKNSGILFWYYMVILDGWCWGAICSLIPLGSLICAFDIVQILFSYTWPAWWKWNIQVMYMYILIKLCAEELLLLNAYFTQNICLGFLNYCSETVSVPWHTLPTVSSELFIVLLASNWCRSVPCICLL